METIKFKNTEIRIYSDEYLESVFSDPDTGSEKIVKAGPNFDAESIARARSLGYDGTDREVCIASFRDHEQLHSYLAYCEGAPYSFTLHAAAHGHKLPLGWVKREESITFALQALYNAGRKGISVTQHIKDSLSQ